MASSPQDQPPATYSTQKQTRAGPRQFWVRLLITFFAIVLIAMLILELLIYFSVPLPHGFVPLLTTLSPIFAGIGAFVNATLSDKDFQQSSRKWLFSDAAEKTKDDKNTAQSNITINVSPTITNTNTNTAMSASESAVQSPLANRVTQQQAAPRTIQAPSSSEPIFFVNMKLPDPTEFHGRMLERIQLLSRTRNGGCTSIVGPRRSGKTWLMSYLRLVARERHGPNFRIGYMSATLPSSATRAGFTGEALRALGHDSYSLPAAPDLALLEHVVKGMVAQNCTPVLCIDEFEGLTHHSEFNLQFFEGLRAITEVGLALVVLSKEPLIDLVSESTRTSPFFNVFLQLTLFPFDRTDAEQFVQRKGAQAQFTKQECAYLLACAQSEREQFPPLRLQLVGETLFNEKHTDQHHYRPNDPEYWHAFQQRVDAAYRGVVKS